VIDGYVVSDLWCVCVRVPKSYSWLLKLANSCGLCPLTIKVYSSPASTPG